MTERSSPPATDLRPGAPRGLPARPHARPAALHGLPAIWLRGNCQCADCLDPGSGQRLVDVTDLPADVVVATVITSGDVVEVVFDPDGHRAAFDRAWLARFASPGPGQLADDDADDRVEDAKRLWSTDAFSDGFPEGSWPRYLSDPAHRRSCLAAVLREGFVRLSDVPCEPGAVLMVAESMGYVRETNYGRLFDVRVEATPANLAYTSLPIAPHTDNPYRDPVPTVQLLHCLHNAVQGGTSGLVDGFAVAAALREQDPAAFGVLTSTPVTFRYSDAATRLRATRPLIGLDPRGRIREIRFNGRSLEPVRLPAEETIAFYAAYRTFAELITSPEQMLTLRLNPGDCLIVDNTRILHARTGFAATGRRHLQGCYADLDGLASTLAVLDRDQAGKVGA
jgi:gamma-butyrobetaine dioxygenase